MKSTPAVFLTSLAVSAFSLTIPLPEATTVLNLFIGEDLTVQETAYAEGGICRHATRTATDADAREACTGTNHNAPGKVTQADGAPLSRSTVYIKRTMPNATHVQPLRASSTERKHALYGRLTRRLHINERAYHPDATHWLRIPDQFVLLCKRMATRIGERCRQAGAREIAAILRR